MVSGIFGKTAAGGDIISRVHGIDGRIKLTYDMFSVSGEYVAAGKHFDRTDLSYNGTDAKPQALAVEGAVDFKVFNKSNTFAVGYAQTWQALALDLPRNTAFASYGIAILKNAILNLEYRHDINYAQGYTGKGRGVKIIKVNDKVSRHKNTVTARLGIYF